MKNFFIYLIFSVYHRLRIAFSVRIVAGRNKKKTKPRQVRLILARSGLYTVWQNWSLCIISLFVAAAWWLCDCVFSQAYKYPFPIGNLGKRLRLIDGDRLGGATHFLRTGRLKGCVVWPGPKRAKCIVLCSRNVIPSRGWQGSLLNSFNRLANKYTFEIKLTYSTRTFFAWQFLSIHTPCRVQLSLGNWSRC